MKKQTISIESFAARSRYATIYSKLTISRLSDNFIPLQKVDRQGKVFYMVYPAPSKPKPLDIAINKVCDFWIEKMTGEANQDNGADDHINKMTMMLANMNMASSQAYLTKPKLDMFRAALAKLIREKWNGYDLTLRVDYDPDEILQNALDAADITDTMCMPWKTYTRIKKDFTVEASHTYNGQLKSL